MWVITSPAQSLGQYARKGRQRLTLKPQSPAAFYKGNPAPGTAQGANYGVLRFAFAFPSPLT
jgi:hypothetical protein